MEGRREFLACAVPQWQNENGVIMASGCNIAARGRRLGIVCACAVVGEASAGVWPAGSRCACAESRKKEGMRASQQACMHARMHACMDACTTCAKRVRDRERAVKSTRNHVYKKTGSRSRTRSVTGTTESPMWTRGRARERSRSSSRTGEMTGVALKSMRTRVRDRERADGLMLLCNKQDHGVAIANARVD